MTKDEQTILETATRLYPATVEQLRKEVRMRPGAFDLAMRGLVNKGFVQLEPLEDCTYVRPMASVGPGPPPLPKDENDPAFM
ncbi:MAG: hypothetical protein GQ558_00910 [Thermoplasmata archaeon]|nr:hypothetical protein [Thermoplasmata archaeon]